MPNAIRIIDDHGELAGLSDNDHPQYALVAGTLAQFAATTSAQLAGVISDETGSGALVFGTSPTFVTSIIAPKIIGGTGTTQTLTYQTTSGVGETGARHIFLVGNNGATEAMTILNNGNVGIGTPGPNVPLEIAQSGNGQILRLGRSSIATKNGFTLTSVAGGLQSFWDLNLGIVGNPNGVQDATKGAIRFYEFNDQAGGNPLWGLQMQRANATWSQTQFLEAGFDASNNPILTISVGTNIAGNVGIGTPGPTNILSLGGNSARIFWMERHTTANTAGNSLTIQSGGATAAATDKAGGILDLKPGISTGSAESGVRIYGNTPGGSSTSDSALLLMVQALANKLGFFAATPVVKQTGYAIPTDLASCISALTALRTALNNYGMTTVV